MNKRYLLPGLVMAATFFSPMLVAEESVEQRLQRLERVVNSQALLDMVQRLDAQEQEIQQLRGRIEEQEHTIEGLRSRQRELYLDTDRRLSRIEREGSGGTPPATQQSAAQPALAAPSVPVEQPTPRTEAPRSPAPLVAPETRDPAPVVDEAQLQQEREAYQKAFDLLRELRYEQATEAFRGFLQQHPDGRYAHIAQYWLGEASYAQRKFEQAITDYQLLIDRFPNSPKRAEAMLKIGYSWNEMQQPGKARPILDRLVREFPNSTEAGQARNLLRQMQ